MLNVWRVLKKWLSIEKWIPIVNDCSLGQSRQRPRALTYPPPCLGPWIRADSHYRRRWLLKCVLCNSLSTTAAFLQRASRPAGESQTQPHHCEILKRFPDHTAPRATSLCLETDHMDHLVKYTEFLLLRIIYGLIVLCSPQEENETGCPGWLVFNTKMLHKKDFLECIHNYQMLLRHH